MSRNIHKILLAHYQTKLSLMLWGSSGYGKTSIIHDFAATNNFDLCMLHAQYLDPLALFIPSTGEMKDLGYVKVYPSEVLHKIFSAKRKMVLFLDELTRAREETFNILTELLLDRKVFGYKVPDHVLMIAASNFSEEDNGVRELPDAVMQRLTHLIHAPDAPTSAKSLKSQLAREILSTDSRLVRPPGRFPIFDLLKACPRQIDACGLLAESGLRGDDLADVCRGRLGIEAGSELSVRFELKLGGIAKILPQEIAPQEFLRIAQAEKECGVIEVIGFLKEQMKHPDRLLAISSYLLEFATPETCRSLQLYGLSFAFPSIPRKANGQLFKSAERNGQGQAYIEIPGKPWQWYATRLGKLTSR
jgi:hypothetical protein